MVDRHDLSGVRAATRARTPSRVTVGPAWAARRQAASEQDDGGDEQRVVIMQVLRGEVGAQATVRRLPEPLLRRQPERLDVDDEHGLHPVRAGGVERAAPRRANGLSSRASGVSSSLSMGPTLPAIPLPTRPR